MPLRRGHPSSTSAPDTTQSSRQQGWSGLTTWLEAGGRGRGPAGEGGSCLAMVTAEGRSSNKVVRAGDLRRASNPAQPSRGGHRTQRTGLVEAVLPSASAQEGGRARRAVSREGGASLCPAQAAVPLRASSTSPRRAPHLRRLPASGTQRAEGRQGETHEEGRGDESEGSRRAVCRGWWQGESWVRSGAGMKGRLELSGRALAFSQGGDFGRARGNACRNGQVARQ